MLETLTPDEPAVFVLREVFGFGYADSGGKTAAARRPVVGRRRSPRCGEIPNFYAIRNPDKLLAVVLPRQISR